MGLSKLSHIHYALIQPMVGYAELSNRLSLLYVLKFNTVDEVK